MSQAIFALALHAAYFVVKHACTQRFGASMGALERRRLITDNSLFRFPVQLQQIK